MQQKKEKQLVNRRVITKHIGKKSATVECKNIEPVWERKCPQCNKLARYSRKDGLTRAIRRNTVCQVCNYKNLKSRGESSLAWRGYKTLGKDKYNTIIRGAKDRGHKFSLTMQDMYDLFATQHGQCALTGELLPDINRSSLDRIDSHRGYELGNVQWVLQEVNFMKHTLPETRFVQLCSMISHHKRGTDG